MRNIEAQQAIGVAMSEAIGSADLKVIANGGDIGSGVSSLTDMLSSAGNYSRKLVLRMIKKMKEKFPLDPKCLHTVKEIRNYSPEWNDGDVHCKKCGGFIRYWDAG